MKIKNQKGFGHLYGLAGLLIGGVLTVGLYVHNAGPRQSVEVSTKSSNSQSSTTKSVTPLTHEVQAPSKPPTSSSSTTSTKPQSSQPPASAPANTPSSTPIKISGDAACISSTTDALKLLSDKAPTHYATVIKYIGIIACQSAGSGMFAYENPPRYVVGDATRNAGTIWYAGTIAHDAGHSKLYHDYLDAHPGGGVPDDVWTGQSAEATCLAAQADALKEIGADQSTIDYVNNIISSQYWNIPYDQRWW